MEKNETINSNKEHLAWLVKSRSNNQKSTLKVRNMIYQYGNIYDDHKIFVVPALLLLDINFSLWRAVFLSDLQEGTAKVTEHAKKFADELIENNTIAYTNDKNAREYSFMYYMNNARYRLIEISNSRPDLLSKQEFAYPDDATDKKWWSHHQQTADTVMENLKKHCKKS